MRGRHTSCEQQQLSNAAMKGDRCTHRQERLGRIGTVHLALCTRTQQRDPFDPVKLVANKLEESDQPGREVGHDHHVHALAVLLGCCYHLALKLGTVQIWQLVKCALCMSQREKSCDF